jgi:hypothetical protein
LSMAPRARSLARTAAGHGCSREAGSRRTNRRSRKAGRRGNIIARYEKAAIRPPWSRPRGRGAASPISMDEAGLQGTISASLSLDCITSLYPPTGSPGLIPSEEFNDTFV